MLEFYLESEGQDGLLGALLSFLHTFSGPGEGSDHFTAVLFGGVLGSIYSLLQFVFAPLWGSLSDRYGRRAILLYTVSGTALSYLLWFFSGSFLLFILSRLLGGAMGGNLSVATAAIADVTSRKNRAKGMALVGVAFGLGFIMGPVIGGFSAGIDVAAIFPGLEVLGVNPFSGAAGVAFLLALINLVWVITRFRETLPPEKRRARFSYAERSPAKVLRIRLEPEVRKTNWIFFVYILSFSGMEFTLTFLANQRFGYGPVEIAVLFVFIGVLIVLTQGLLVRRMVPAFGEKMVTLTGLILVMAGLFTVGMAYNVPVLYFGLALMAVGSGLINPALSALVSLYTSAERQGEILGVFRSLGSLGRAIGPLLASFVFWWYGSSFSYSLGAVMLFIPLVLAFFLPRPFKGEDPEKAEEAAEAVDLERKSQAEG